MSISPVKRLILETMWMMNKPAKATEIAREAGLAFPPAMMHILGLARLGYVSSPEKGIYAINQNGKKVLGVEVTSKEQAAGILEYLPMEKSFHFYADIGKPTNIHATSLSDFCDKILKIDIPALEFHVARGDFEAWFAGLGDSELARKTLLIREQKITGESLRHRLYDVVKGRFDELVEIRGSQMNVYVSSDAKLA